MAVFFTDLDNTLIYSHNRTIPGEKIVVEYLHGREQSYMTAYSYSFLRSLSGLCIIPVTTRTCAQYERIQCMDEFHVREAIVCNGGMLLVDGSEDLAWSEETVSKAGKELDELENACDLLQGIYSGTCIQRPAPYMAYWKTDNPARTCKEIEGAIKTDRITVQHDQKKVYLFAASVNKGSAIQRYCSRSHLAADIAAGDDIMDIPMLNHARYALAAERIAGLVKNNNLVILNGDVRSDQICREIERFQASGVI